METRALSFILRVSQNGERACGRWGACHGLICISWSFPTSDAWHGTNAARGRWMCSSPGGAKASRMSVPQQQSPVCGGASGLKAGGFNCSMALSPAQHLAKQVCSGGIISTSVPALTELNKAQQFSAGSHPLYHFAPGWASRQFSEPRECFQRLKTKQ